ncbi:MAG: hypothetical protein IPO56_12585 [Flavobacteriales bacterium]|nr:hypothetical protein [Flavobacteriales bacterium]
MYTMPTITSGTLNTMLAKALLEGFQTIGLQSFHVFSCLSVLGISEIVTAGLHGCLLGGLGKVWFVDRKDLRTVLVAQIRPRRQRLVSAIAFSHGPHNWRRSCRLPGSCVSGVGLCGHGLTLMV